MSVPPTYQSDYADSVDSVAAELAAIRREWRTRQQTGGEYGRNGFPSRAKLDKIMQAFAGVLFPLRLGPDFVLPHNEDTYVQQTLSTALARLYGQVRLELLYKGHQTENATLDDRASAIVGAVARSLPSIRRQLDLDVEAARDGDPAARSVEEVLICYPSILAIIHHRIAHRLFQEGAVMVARIISEVAHSHTGIDIHPGAEIGERFFIDHGTGVVVGETAVIGNRVRLYQGVTLGARGFVEGPDGRLAIDAARHPIIEDDVVIYAGASILGRVTVGKGSEIGGNVWLTHDVPPHSRVAQANAQTRIAARPTRPGKDTAAKRA